uniref:Peptidase S1 domain-containing protein n=1 Tax=Romanomermis culicivorax TaxID=13658 RepID=A0A915HYW7_ROMCU
MFFLDDIKLSLKLDSNNTWILYVVLVCLIKLSYLLAIIPVGYLPIILRHYFQLSPVINQDTTLHKQLARSCARRASPSTAQSIFGQHARRARRTCIKRHVPASWVSSHTGQCRDRCIHPAQAVKKWPGLEPMDWQKHKSTGGKQQMRAGPMRNFSGSDRSVGDSGGPFVCLHNGKYRLQGVTSFGKADSCSDSSFTNVVRMKRWILETIERMKRLYRISRKRNL